MPEGDAAFIKLGDAGQAPVLNYNVPDRTSYSGNNIIDLQLDERLFKPDLRKAPARVAAPAPAAEGIANSVRQALATGYFSTTTFPHVRTRTNALALSDYDFATAAGGAQAKASTALAAAGAKVAVSPIMPKLNADTVAQRIAAGERLNVYRNMFGSYRYNVIREPAKAQPRLLVVETYRLSSFLGNYGAGRTLSTFSLLPGEKTKILIKSYTKTTTEATAASSIFDSFSDESSDDFENSVQNENSDRTKQDENFAYYADADAHAGWGWGSANIKGGVKGGTSSSREQFSKNVSNASEKHAQKASAKRDVKVDTTSKSTAEAGTENSVEREIQNINVGRTLNFVVRQLNQEFIAILHLIDVKVAFWNGFAESRREVPLYQLGDLIADIAADAGAADELMKTIRAALDVVIDYQGDAHKLVEDYKPFADESAYLRVRKNEFEQVYEDETGNKFTVPGIITAVNKHTLRTDAVIVEAVLGQGNALDPYSAELQDEAVRAKKLGNDSLEGSNERDELGRTVVSTGTPAQADAFAKVFYPPASPVLPDA
jgi:hypothetical protein